MRRLLCLAALLVLAPMPAKAQQQASQALTLTVSTGGPESAHATFPLTVIHSGTITWQAGTPGANPIAGYNVFRSTKSGGAIRRSTRPWFPV
jgi:hypothetical protein